MVGVLKVFEWSRWGSLGPYPQFFSALRGAAVFVTKDFGFGKHIYSKSEAAGVIRNRRIHCVTAFSCLAFCCWPSTDLSKG